MTWKAYITVTIILRWFRKGIVRRREKILSILKFQTYLITLAGLESTYREICEQWRELIKKRWPLFYDLVHVAAIIWIFLKSPGRPTSDFYYLCISSSQCLTVTTYECLTSVGLLLLGSVLRLWLLFALAWVLWYSYAIYWSLHLLILLH